MGLFLPDYLKSKFSSACGLFIILPKTKKAEKYKNHNRKF